jgi:carbamoyltransferase
MALTLGFSGGPNAVHERTFPVYPGAMHDAAAVLLDGDRVVAAVEQERLDRIKHSNKAPFDAIRACLREAGAKPKDVQTYVFYGEEGFWNGMLRDLFLHDTGQRHLLDARSLLRTVLARELGCELPQHQPLFVNHHLAHAMSAMAMSGFDSALVLSIDGQGDDIAGMVLAGRGTRLEVLERIPVAKSLGYFYLNVIEFLGYRIFDEYKVMGLAPYGDPGRYDELFSRFYTLEPEGRYAIHWPRLQDLFDVLVPRRSGEPFTQVHKDVAAALQSALERIAFHVLVHWQRQTGHRHLCMAGGVAHNCTLNGKLLYSGLFDDIFVQPASHDAGCALGAALYCHYQEAGDAEHTLRLEHVYWGPQLGDEAEIEQVLRAWGRFVEYERPADLERTVARFLSTGSVIGWVQGRSEFGPRALGNRSILADARPASHKDLINAMVKKREAYRPFAPSIPEERTTDFFETPPGRTDFPFMVFTLQVREDKRELLGAVTHVDGTARIQTVSRSTNERYWRLLQEFGEATGVPVLLNTSFNNHAEPVVDSADDAVVCFLTTRLHLLVIGDFLVRKREVSWEDHLALVPSLPRHVVLRQRHDYAPERGWGSAFEIGSNQLDRPGRALSAEGFGLLARCDGERTVGELLETQGIGEAGARQQVVDEMLELWSARLVRMQPGGLR